MQRVPDHIFERQAGGFFLPRSRSAPAPPAKASANRPLELLALEDRVFYSAVPLDIQPDASETEPTAEPPSIDWQLANLEHWAELLDAGGENHTSPPNQSAPSDFSLEERGSILVVVDRGIADYEQLVQDIQTQLPQGHSLLLIDSTADGWQQLTDFLDRRARIQELHLFSHAVSGELQLGTARVDLDDLLSDETSAIWQRALNPNADILLYGCALAADEAGSEFVSRFAQFTGADVAASTDRTGTGPAGDWELEFTIGSLSNISLFAESSWLGWEGYLDAETVSLVSQQSFSGLDRGSTQAVAMHSDGSYVVVYSDLIHSGSPNWGISAIRFDASGNQLSTFSVNQTTPGDQRYASIDMDDAGNFVVTWTSPSETPGSADIWARWFGAAGGSSNEFQVNSYTPSGQFNSSVSMAGDGRFAIVWEGNGTDDSQGIYVRLYDANRNAVGSQIWVNSSSGGSQENPIVSMNDSGDFVVAWSDETSFYYQRFDSLGAKVGNASTVSSIGTARHGDILLNDDGTVVITWQEFNGTTWDVFWQRNAANDSTLIAKTLIRSNTTTDQLAPSVDGSGDGEFVITWEAGEFSDSWGVFYQLYNASGLATPYTFWANNNYAPGYQGNASVAVNSLEQFVIVWSGQYFLDSSDVGHNNILNRAPTLAADSGLAIENGGYNNNLPGTGAAGNVLANDTDPDPNDTLTVLGVIAGSGGYSTSNLNTPLSGLYGTLTLSNTGEYAYSLNNANASVQALRSNTDTLSETFTYTAEDQFGMVGTATLTVTIRGRNDGPTATADAGNAVEAGGLANSTSGSNPSGNVLTNDTDPDSGDTKTVSGVTAGTSDSATGNVGTAVAGSYGSLTIAADGSFNYSLDNLNPAVQSLRNSGQTLTDVFTYTFRDADGLSSTTQLTVTITGSNDTPELGLLNPVSIDENTVNGTILRTASATDVDSGETLSFSLSDNAGGRFAINPSTGAISVANSGLLNFESAISHSITIQVTDLAGAFSQQTLTINLNDVNEFAIGPISDTNATVNSVAENATNGTLARITAAATDGDASATVTYSLDDNAGGRFAINSSTGIVTVADNSLLNFESASSHSIIVRATSSDGSSSTQSFSIAITDVNEFQVSTPIDTNPAVNEVLENSAAGTLVGITGFASDADGSNNTITYSLTDNAGGRFAINSSTGVVTLTGTSVNYEQSTSHTITIRAQSSDGSNRTQNFTVQVLDNGAEVSGITDTNSTANVQAENATLGSSVITASASHAGSLSLTWSLTNNASGRFAIDSATGVVTLASALNYETGTSHTITVRADASDGSFAANNFTITVTDIDEFDIGPITDSNATANSVAENAANGTNTGYRASASDADGSTNTITYSLDNNAGGRFSINSSTGVVTVANSSLLNFETETSHSITVRATSADGSFSTANTTIAVSDVDEFNVGIVSDLNPASNSLSENSANGTAAGITASASDPDGSNNTISFSLTDSAGGRFSINNSTGVVTVANSSLLNFENASSHSITVRAASSDGSFTDQAFTITLSDIDEFDVGPVSDSNPSTNSVAENSTAGTLVGLTASASDADGTTSAITYSLDNDAGGRFAINSSTGVVSVLNGAPLNFEAASSHTITVRASSQDGSSSTQAFTINLSDVDEFDVGAISDTDTAADNVAENAPNGTAAGITAAAADADATSNSITYTLDDTAGGRFAINESTGVVTVANSLLLNREAAATYTITVRAASSDGSFSTQSFTIDLTDVDEFDVGPVSDSNATANSVPENAANGTAIGITASASDADATTNTITYSLDDSAGGRFAINSATGLVTVANGTLLNREAASSYTITVRAASSDGSFSTQSFTIDLTDVDEFDLGPVSDTNAAANSVAENAANGTAVGITASASDADATTNTTSYSLDDSAGGRFAINSSAGVVTVANGTLLNREAASSYTITVRAASSDGSFSTQNFTIDLTDVDEFDVGPVSDSNATANNVAESAANGTAVGIIASASDADATNNTITYSLDDNAGGRFAINNSNGVVTVADGSLLNFEASTSHTITVRATSTDGSFSSQTFTISVNNVNEGPVAINDSTVAVEAGGIFNATPGTNPTGNVLANDTDPDNVDTKTVIGVAAGLPSTTSGQVGQAVVGQYGSLLIHADGSYAYTLDNSNSAVQALRTAGDALVDTFTYTMADAANSQSTARLSILITGVNDAPTAQWSEAGLNINAGSSNNQYVELSNFDQLIGGQSTFTMRLSISTTQSTFFLFSYASSNNDNEFRIYAYDGTLRLTFDNQNWDTGIDSTSIADGQRHEIAIVRDSGLAQLKLFVDGQLQAQHNLFKWLVNAESGGTAVLAQEQDSIGGHFDSGQIFRGTIWDLSFYNSAWTNERISNESGRVDAADGNLRGYWNFDQLNGNQITEQIAGRDGILKSITGSGWVAGAAQITQTDWLAPINEHPGNGFSIGTLKAADLDSADSLTWSLSDNAGGRFAINSSTGKLTVANSALVDRETAGSFQITAVASDLAGGSFTRTYVININDVDEFDVSPVLDGNASSNEVAENAANGSQIGLAATALDADATNSTITFTLDDSAGGRFAINASTGVVTVANSSLLNREVSASHSITVRATSADGSSATESFTISVTDVDEFDIGTLSDANPAANQVAENAAAGTAVGITALAADLDATNSEIIYALDNSAGGRFAINSSTGVVTVANGSLLNYEAATSHSITIRATSADGSFSTQSVAINLDDLDEFDVGPVSDSNPSLNQGIENAANGTTIGITASASDPDGTTSTITYSLDDDAGGRFAINSTTGVVTVANGTLLDREAATSHSVTIRATSADGSSSITTLEVEVGNANEAPLAAVDQGTASEAGGLGNSNGGSTATGNVLTNDLDPDAGDVLSVTGIQAGTNPPPAGPVGVSVTGTYGTLLLNANGSYTYTVNNAHPDVEALRGVANTLQDTFTYRMRDAGGLESTSQLVLTITGSNDTPSSMWSETGLGVNPEPSNNQYVQFSDFGNLLAGDQFTLRLAVSTTDSSGTFFSYATNSDNNELRLHLSSGKLRVYLDGQQWVTNIPTSLIADGQRHELSIARDVASGQVNVYVDGVLKDSNSNWKSGIRLDAGGSLVLGQDQDSIGGSFDPDEAFSGTFWDMSVYSTAWDAAKLNLAGGQTQHSEPDLKGHWDFDLLGSNAILDLIGGRHGSLLSITPSAEWIAGTAQLVEADWKPRIAENSVTGRVISSLRAEDIDDGEVLNWSLRDDAGGRFAIDSSTGLLTVADGSLLNYEQQQTHTVIVRVTDAGGLFREETYTIQLADVQETGVSVPVDLDPAANRVSENASAGTSTGLQAWAIDEDGTTNEVSYSLLDNAGGRFMINAQTGIVTVLNGSLLDREQAASHQVTVRATSADGTFEDRVFTIQVDDVDEFDIGSIADLNTVSNSVTENAAAGSSVGIRASAVDVDATLNSITYSLTDDAGGRFAIDSQTGLVTVADAGLLDFETATNHTISIRATSQDGSTSFASFTIVLTDVNEFDIGPITDSDPVSNLIFENSVAGTYVGITAFAQDQDATQNTVNWRLLNDDGGRFAIDSVTGRIVTTQALDFEALGSVRQVRVEGSSTDGSRTERDFQIEIGNVLTESFTVFSGLNVAMTPQELLQSSSHSGEQYQSMTITDLPTIGSLYVIGAQGKQAITANELSQLMIPVGQQLVYEAPVSNTGTVTVAYAASTVSGQSRTGTVTIQVEPAMIIAPVAPPSSSFSSSSSSSGSTSSSSTGGSSSGSSSSNSGGESSSSQSGNSSVAESTQSTATAGESGTGSGAAVAAVGPLPASGASVGSDTMSGEATEADSNSSEQTGSSSGDARDESSDRNQAEGSSDATQLANLEINQTSQGGSLQISNEPAAATRVLASATSIQQEFLATAQFSDYLTKLNSALEETPLVVGFEMPAYATAGASLFTVGYVAWLIRGGVLLTSFMSSIPSWQSFDPLPILENAGSGDDDLAGGDDTSIAELVDSDQPAPPSFASTG